LTAAIGKHALALLATLNTTCVNVDGLDQASAELFQQHPDYAIITNVPGLADSTGARLLAEIDDDRSRFSHARALNAYAGCAPITRASGRSISIIHRLFFWRRRPSVARAIDEWSARHQSSEISGDRHRGTRLGTRAA
jgi:transposase